MKTDNELKQLAATMLPNNVLWYKPDSELIWAECGEPVLETEMDHIARLCEATLIPKEKSEYMILIWNSPCFKNRFEQHTAPWQQRIELCAKVKGLI